MSSNEVNLFLWLIRIFNVVVLVGWPLLSLLTLFALRGRGLNSTTLAIWVLIIVAVPFLGAVAFWIVRPGDRQPPFQT